MLLRIICNNNPVSGNSSDFWHFSLIARILLPLPNLKVVQFFKLSGNNGLLHRPNAAFGKVGKRAFSEMAGEGENTGDQRDVSDASL